MYLCHKARVLLFVSNVKRLRLEIGLEKLQVIVHTFGCYPFESEQLTTTCMQSVLLADCCTWRKCYRTRVSTALSTLLVPCLRCGFGAGWQKNARNKDDSHVLAHVLSPEKKFHVIFAMIWINILPEPTRNCDMRKKPIADVFRESFFGRLN